MKNNLSITVLTNEYLSFVNQAENLVLGFIRNNRKAKLVTFSNAHEIGKDDIVIVVGSWKDWPFIQKIYREYKHVIPWLVSDDKVLKYVDDINKVPILVTTSNYCKEVFVKYGVKKEKIIVIPECIDTEYWREISKKEIAKFGSVYNLNFVKDGMLKLLTIGGDGTSKGAREAIESLSKIEKTKYYYLIKISDTSSGFFQGNDEKKMIEELDVKENVRYIMGNFNQDFIKLLFNWCDVYIAPSRHEGFGLPQIEAMSCGKPVITCKGTAAEETSVDNKTGFIVSSEGISYTNIRGYKFDGVKADVTELRKSIEKFVKNKDIVNEFGLNARKHIIDNYECKKIAQIFLDKTIK